MISYAFDIVVAPYWICMVLSFYALTFGGLVWRLMVGTILVFNLLLAAFSVHSYFEASGYWPLPMVVGGPITLIALLMLWYSRNRGDPLINSNSWRAALVFLVPMAAIVLLMVGYKAYLSSREEACKETCRATGQQYEYRSPVFGDGGSGVSRGDSCTCY